jgi:hypothetical protein
LNEHSSYIVIDNASNFTKPDLDVLKDMVILRDQEDSNYATFESEAFTVEGSATKVSSSESRIH